MMKVNVWEEIVSIPTYEVGVAEKNPIFLEKRVYQGSSGSVYPYPVIEKIEDAPIDKDYKGLFLENEYIKVMILPELGGRVQMAYDKIKNRHFVYYNSVIKPALVGLLGPWISGGIEFNWPQHHRPSTYMPIDYKIEELPDGGAVVWVNEQERMFHQKGVAGFTLRPGSAVLEIQGRVSNPTPFPQTFLWWANPAVVVNDGYQSVFPPDVNAVFDHGKRAVSSFPIATGEYYKYDYSRGVDISRYKNIPVPTSYMAIKSAYDFVGGYENDLQAGVLHVANHHISPGKKQWTWGNGDFGIAWDRNLTDNDGPYIELMTGVYTDNQPDFSWLQPYEEKSFVQYFMPYRELGLVKQASVDMLMNVELVEKGAEIKLQPIREFDSVRVEVIQNGTSLLSLKKEMSPKQIECFSIEGVNTLLGLEIYAYLADGQKVVSWKPEVEDIKQIPAPAQPAKLPEDIKTNEELFLTGQHIEQYRHATYDPMSYYMEALKRDPKDVRCNNAIGLLLMRKGCLKEAIPYFDTAIARQIEKNPNPYDGEALYNRGLAYKLMDETELAYESLYKSCWNAAWQDAGYYTLAQISSIRGHWTVALDEIEKSLIRNWHNHRARHLKALIYRKLSLDDKALKWIDDSLEIDHFNFGCLFEKYLLNKITLDNFVSLIRRESHNYEEIAWDYMNAGLYKEAIKLLQIAKENCESYSATVNYMLVFCYSKLDDTKAVNLLLDEALDHTSDYCFPNRIEVIQVLETVMSLNPNDFKAPYYLGNLWYDKRQYDRAIACWEKSISISTIFPTVLRNLSLAYFNKYDRVEEAVRLLEQAYRLDETDARILFELDQLYKRLNYAHQERFDFLDTRIEIVKQRDDLYLEYITLLNNLGDTARGMDLIAARKFHPWEGGEGKVTAQYLHSHIEEAKKALIKEDYEKAITLLSACYEYPHNLGEGKLAGAQDNDIDYWMGCVYEKCGEQEKAQAYYRKASLGAYEPAAAIYYNDQKPEKIFYQGLAYLKLGEIENAHSKFNKLITYGKQHLYDEVRIEYFAVSLPDLLIWEDDLNHRNKIHCYYLIGLGMVGKGMYEEGRKYLTLVQEKDNNHQGVMVHIK